MCLLNKKMMMDKENTSVQITVADIRANNDCSQTNV